MLNILVETLQVLDLDLNSTWTLDLDFGLGLTRTWTWIVTINYPFYPQIISVEDGDALDIKITLNLKNKFGSSGCFAANIGNFHVLILHRVVRLFQVNKIILNSLNK